MTERPQETAQNLSRLVEQSVNTLQEVDRRLQMVRGDLAALISKASELQAQNVLGPQPGPGQLGPGQFGAFGFGLPPGTFGGPPLSSGMPGGMPSFALGPVGGPALSRAGDASPQQADVSERARREMPPVPRMPPMDLVDAGEEFRLHLEMPGVKKDDLDILVSERTVTVSGQVRPEPAEGTPLLAERVPVVYRRMLQLPAEVNTTQTKATFKDGILTLKVPKKSPGEGPRRIDVAYG